MGIYVNPDNEAFITSLNTKPYVDKSGLIGALNENVNTNHSSICVSRPRRFGKTMAMEMAFAYYSKGCDSRAIFEKLEFSKSEDWDRYLNKFNVIRLDLINFFDKLGSAEDKVNDLNNCVLAELKKEFTNTDLSAAKDIIDAIRCIYQTTKEKFAIFIDEYDFPIRTCSNSDELRPYLSFLNRLFKNSDLKNAIALAYLTGILPPIADRVESKLNNFTVYTMIEPNEMAPYFGFTTDEVSKLCEEFGLDIAECKKWYDGYKFANFDSDIYNPQAVVSAVRNKHCGSYWSQTGSYQPISLQINRDVDGIREAIILMLADREVPVDVKGYLNSLDTIKTREHILTYLIHLGYLAYNSKEKRCRIPNNEIKDRWSTIISDASNYTKVKDVIAKSDQLLEDTISLKSDKVAEGLRDAHSRIGTILTYNSEATLQCAIYIAYFSAIEFYTVFKEVPMGEGVADLLYIPFESDKPAIIIELKVDQSTTVALNQIENKRYAQPLEGYHGNVLRVAVNYNRKSKKHECEIRKETI